MKVSMRISLGYGILLVSILILAAVQIFAIRRLQVINEATARPGLSAAMTSLELMQDAELIAQYTGRFFQQADPEARKQLDSLRDSFQYGLQERRRDLRSEPEGRELDRLSQFWEQFLTDLSREQSVSQRGDLPPALSEDLDRLRTQSRTVYETILASIQSQAEESRTFAGRIERLSWIFTAAVIVVGGLITVLIARSVSTPLSSLAKDTRAMAEGRHYFRLDTSRNDEIAQIAKDFNTITDRLKSVP